jgi:hypothetical protein
MTIELDSTLAQAEVLFLSFQQLVEDMDRRRAEVGTGNDAQLRQRGAGGASTLVSIPELSPELRELLENTRPEGIEVLV